jgi:hypothetical protein
MQYKILFFLLLTVPMVAYGATPRNFAEVVTFILGYVRLLIALLFGVTFVVFIWGLTKAWILNGDSPESIEKGQQMALWGIIGLAVMASMWGIISLVRSSAGLQ